ncbi:MAG: hypothetical protein KDB94_14045 [Acidobacteria bacterium]|nr:hypothetical protein [Acidobacteriota bacterium]MCB9377746.1 hypothetical protein [Holophagales bacterium]
MLPLPVRFFLPEPSAELERLAAGDADRDWRELTTGDRIWILQTFLRLKARGLPVELVAEPPVGRPGILLFHSKHEKALLRRPRAAEQVLVGVRADNRQPLAAEFEVVQNGRFADGVRRFFLPHWPQPGLLPRDPARGDRIEVASYKGYLANLRADFRAPDWEAWLGSRGVRWQLDAIDFDRRAEDADHLLWADYRAVDLLVAVRPPERKFRYAKPASKLVNCWLAGVPALLGVEYAARELRRDPLDYLEVPDAEAARAAIERLLGDPGEYRARIEHGRVRGRELAPDSIADRWQALLFETLPPLAARGANRRSRGLPVGVRRLARLLRRWARLEPAR